MGSRPGRRGGGRFKSGRWEMIAQLEEGEGDEHSFSCNGKLETYHVIKSTVRNLHVEHGNKLLGGPGPHCLQCWHYHCYYDRSGNNRSEKHHVWGYYD